MTVTLDRRRMQKPEAATMAAAVGGLAPPAFAANVITERSASELKWDKAPAGSAAPVAA